MLWVGHLKMLSFQSYVMDYKTAYSIPGYVMYNFHKNILCEGTLYMLCGTL